MTVHLHIEHLILDGVPVAPHERETVKAAVEAELMRLIADQGLPAGRMTGGAVPSLPGVVLQLESDGTPLRLGTQIAEAVHGSLNRSLNR